MSRLDVLRGGPSPKTALSHKEYNDIHPVSDMQTFIGYHSVVALMRLILVEQLLLVSGTVKKHSCEETFSALC